MNYTSSSWFHLSNFTKKGCGFQWMLGVGKWKGVKDALTGAPIKYLETVFWNRELGNVSVGLNSYMNVRNDPKYKDKLNSLGLPDDINV